MNIITHDEKFNQRTRDEDWIKVVSEKRWLIITCDKALLKNNSQFTQISNAKTATFIIDKFNSCTLNDGFKFFVKILPKLYDQLDKYGAQGIYTVNKVGKTFKVDEKAKRDYFQRKRRGGP